MNEFFNNWAHLNLSSLVTIGFGNCAFSKQGYIDSSYCYGYWIGVEFIACNVSNEPYKKVYSRLRGGSGGRCLSKRMFCQSCLALSYGLPLFSSSSPSVLKSAHYKI